MTPFGARLRELREARGIALKDMAADVGVTPAYLSALEHGHRGRPGSGLVMLICGSLGLIWDEAEDLKRLAEVSRPKVSIDTGGLSPAATELANRLAERIRDLDDATLAEMLALVDRPPAPVAGHRGRRQAR
ncbi:Transcriptional regulator, XRE family [Caenispirillum salinarum AK4]|uniref:Transcriptional regulator, XRE family n=1 Tax=Caenispirillum salinarum AK4 TaxID=1238182 RepID=K9H1Q7_9PROT|nr:helix-turn-helix domain-containing protein [Caenispirillum salinarum]EKV32140.1 Transcriptional regulator, XRE family [Caenispirillum salinarum AK4]